MRLQWHDAPDNSGFFAIRKTPVRTGKGNLLWLGGEYRVVPAEQLGVHAAKGTRRWVATFRGHDLGGVWRSARAAMTDISRCEAKRES
jgi:hypothetical protein